LAHRFTLVAGLDQWFPTFLDLKHPTEKNRNLRDPVAKPICFEV